MQYVFGMSNPPHTSPRSSGTLDLGLCLVLKLSTFSYEHQTIHGKDQCCFWGGKKILFYSHKPLVTNICLLNMTYT